MDSTGTEKTRVARELARKHYLVEPGLKHVFRLTTAAERELIGTEPIKLLEVNENTIAAGVMPLHFGPAPGIGIPFSSIIVEVTPHEFELIRSHQLKLPDDWQIAEELPQPNGAGSE